MLNDNQTLNLWRKLFNKHIIDNGDLMMDLSGRLVRYDKKPEMKKYKNSEESAKEFPYRLDVGEECYIYPEKEIRNSDYKNAKEYLKKVYGKK